MYGFSISMKGSMNEVCDKVTEALKAEGFGVLTEIDVQATLKQKINVDRKPYKILGACNPKLAHQAISAEPDIGLLLPCNVVVREEDDGSMTVAFMDPAAVLSMVDNAQVHEIAPQVKTKLEKVRDLLAEA